MTFNPSIIVANGWSGDVTCIRTADVIVSSFNLPGRQLESCKVRGLGKEGQRGRDREGGRGKEGQKRKDRSGKERQ